MNILISCDDGFGAEGFAALAAEAARLGAVRAAAPELPSSGAGHAVTLHVPVGVRRDALAGCEAAVAVRGTPADAVKLALAGAIWKDWRADLVLTGINRGPNVGVNVFYSGTVGAAAEAAVSGVSSIALSLDIPAPFDFQAAALRARPVLERLAALAPFPPGAFFNVNLPKSALPEPRGIRLTRHGLSGFREWYEPVLAPQAHACQEPYEYFEVDGAMTVRDPDEWTDAAALAAGYISVTPMFLDLTVEPLRRRESAQAEAFAKLLDRLADWR